MSTEGQIILVRHGETEGQSSIRLHGSSDVPLSTLGRAQMLAVQHHLISETFSAAVCSPLSRSRDGAAIVLGERPITARVFDPFREIHFGMWEGWTIDEVEQRDPENFRRWCDAPQSFCYPGGEGRVGFQQRVREGIVKAFNRNDQSIVAVLHKGVIKVVLGELLGLDLEAWMQLPVDLGGIYRLRWCPQDSSHGWQIVEHNFVPPCETFADAGAGGAASMSPAGLNSPCEAS